MKNIIKKESIQRLIKDVKEIKKCPLSDHGIYYCHDEADMLTGRALIVGPKNTPYFGGNYFFRFRFPEDYPFQPPIVTCCTQGEKIRFNPNLYTTGKVCLSILNTWHGECWSSCQTISTVLLAIQTILCETPLLNEPGFTSSHRDIGLYNEVVLYKNIDIAIIKMMMHASNYFLDEFQCFEIEMAAEFAKNKNEIKMIIETQLQKTPTKQRIFCQTYNMKFDLCYNELREKFMQIIP